MDDLIKWLLIAVLIGILIILFPAILVFLGAILAALWAVIVTIAGWIAGHVGTAFWLIIIAAIVLYIIFD